MLRQRFLLPLLLLLLVASCAENRIHEKKEWDATFQKNGITQGAFMLRDHTHDAIYYNNLERCSKRYTPASTFKIFNTLVGFEEGILQDDQSVFKWDGTTRWNENWNKDLTVRDAFKASCVPCYQDLARRTGKPLLQHYLDTVNYGNKTIGNAVDEFWLDGSLLISADEQVGLMRRLYFNELPFSDRTQRLVRSIMLWEEDSTRRLYYKTGTNNKNDTGIYWVVGFTEKIVRMKEHKNSMNKSNVREMPYFFAMNFTTTDTTQDWKTKRIALLKELLHNAGAW